MSERVYVVTGYYLDRSDPQEVIGVARTYRAAAQIAMEWLDELGANIDDPMRVKVDAEIEIFDLVG